MWGVRCTRNETHKGTKPYFASEREIGMVNADSTSLVKYETPMGEVELSVEAIRLYLSPKATVAEAYMFLQKCRFQRLNPFLGEAYLVIYEQTERSPRTAAMMIGKEAHTRRAERHPDYQGMQAGVMVRRGAEIHEAPGAFVMPGDVLLGGWCKVLRKGKEPTFIAVSLQEYDNGRRQWKQMPATMIRKVAVVQALREAFPNEMAGLQGGDEFALAEDQPGVIEGEIVNPGKSAEVIDPAPAPPAENRDLERDIADLYPDTSPAPGPVTSTTGEVFDPETAPPPPLPGTIHSQSHFEQVLKDEGWNVARLELQVLNMALDRYIREGHKLQDAYLAWRKHMANEPK